MSVIVTVTHPVVVAEEEMTFEKCKELCDFAMTEDGDAPPFIMDMEVLIMPEFSFHSVFCWSSQKQISVMMIDAQDDTPLMVVADGRALIYDVLRGRLVSIDPCEIRALFTMEDDDMVASFGWKVPGGSDAAEEHKKPSNHVDIDFGAILDRGIKNLGLGKRKEGVFEFIMVSRKGGRCRVVAEPASTIPLRTFEVLDDDETSIMTLTVDDSPKLDASCFVPPDDRFRESGVLIEPVNSDKFLELSQLFPLNFLLRGALEEQRLRPKLEAQQGAKIDWDELGRKDKEYAAKLREVFAHEIRLWNAARLRAANLDLEE